MPGADSKIAKQLLETKLLDQFQYRSVQDHLEKVGGRFHMAVLELGLVPEEKLIPIVSRVVGLPPVSFAKLQVDPKAIALLDGPFCAENLVFPCALRDKGQTLWLAMADPIDGRLVMEVRRRTKLNVRPLVGRPSEIRNQIQETYGRELDEANPFGGSGIDLSLSDAEAEQEQAEFKVTDMSGNTLVRHAGDIRQEGRGAAKLAEQLDEQPIPARAPGARARPVAEPELTVEQRLERIAANQQKATRIIKALAGLCIEKGLFTSEEFANKRKP